MQWVNSGSFDGVWKNASTNSAAWSPQILEFMTLNKVEKEFWITEKKLNKIKLENTSYLEYW